MEERTLKTGNSMQHTHTRDISNDLSALREMSVWLETILRELHMPEDLIFNFDLCANEAVSNIINYGFPDDGAHLITLRVSLQGATLSLEIEDDGRPFNPPAHTPHARPASLEEAKIGGLGIELIRSFMDECHYTCPHGHNLFRMVAYVPDAH